MLNTSPVTLQNLNAPRTNPSVDNPISSSESPSNKGTKRNYSELNASVIKETKSSSNAGRQETTSFEQPTKASALKNGIGLNEAESGKFIPLDEAAEGKVFVSNKDLALIVDGSLELESSLESEELSLEQTLLENSDSAVFLSEDEAIDAGALDKLIGHDLIDNQQEIGPIQPMPVEHQEVPWVQLPVDWEVSNRGLTSTSGKGDVGLSVNNLSIDGQVSNGKGGSQLDPSSLLPSAVNRKGGAEQLKGDSSSGSLDQVARSQLSEEALQKIGSGAEKLVDKEMTGQAFVGKASTGNLFALAQAGVSHLGGETAASEGQGSAVGSIKDLKFLSATNGLQELTTESVKNAISAGERATLSKIAETTNSTVAQPSVTNIAAQSTDTASINDPRITSTTQTSQPALTTEPLQVYGKNWQQNIGRHVLWMQQNGINSAEIQLDPAELGPISLKISTQGNETQVLVQATHSQTRELLEQNQQRLRDLMEQGGMLLSQFDVSDESPKQQDTDQADGLNGGPQTESNYLADDSASASETIIHHSASGLDLFV